jgi:hypothetical protein
VNHGHFVGIDLPSNNSYISIIDKGNGCGSEPSDCKSVATRTIYNAMMKIAWLTVLPMP